MVTGRAIRIPFTYIIIEGVVMFENEIVDLGYSYIKYRYKPGRG